jgi:hypothetical protein
MMFASDFVEPKCNFVRMVSSSADVGAVRSELARLGVFCAEIDGSRIDSEESLFLEIGRALQFPDYFGQNWDALIDCLRDLGWMAAIGCVVFVRDAATAFRRAPSAMARFVETCGDAAAFWREHEQPFHLVLLMPLPET